MLDDNDTISESDMDECTSMASHGQGIVEFNAHSNSNLLQ